MESYIVKIRDDKSKKEIILPMTPSEITKNGAVIERGFNTIVGGDKPRPKGRKPYTYDFSGILLDEGFDLPQYSHIAPREFEDLVADWQGYRAPYNKKLRLIVSNTSINRFVYLANHSIDYRGAGKTLHYTLQFVEWRDFDIKVYDATKTSTEQKKRPPTAKPTVYTVKKGDSLSKITKKYTGNVSKWRELYELNKSKLKSKDPNLIYPGEKLTIPMGWLK